MPYKLIPPGRRRGNPFWIIRCRRPDGKEFEGSTHCTDKADAERTAATIYARICAEGPAAAKPLVATFSDAADAYIRYRKPGRVELNRIERLTLLLGNLPIGAVGQDDLVRASSQHPSMVTGATLNREYVRPFAAIIHYARDAGIRGDLRVRAFKEKAPNVRVADKAAVATLIANAATEPQRLLLHWLWEIGSRLGDTLRLSWSDLDLPASTVRLTIGKRGGHSAILPLPATLVARLGNMPEKRGRLFPWATKSGVYKWLGPLCAKTGVMFRPHDARRALATEQFDAGADARLVQELMGHGSIKSTMRYRHVGVTRLADAQKKRG